MRILFVSLFLPQEKAYHAGGRYVFELLRRLSLHHEVHLATRLEEGEFPSLPELAPYCAQIHPFSYPQVAKRNLAGTLRLLANYLAFSRFANKLIREGTYDLVQVEWVETAILIHRGAAPMVLDAHDVITKPAERAFLRSRGVRRLFQFAKFLLVRAAEKRIMSRFDRIFTLSEFDRGYLLALSPTLPVATIPIPAGLDLKPTSYPRVRHRLLFLASYRYRPENVEAALWFHRLVLPLVRREFPDAEFVIAGYGPPGQLTELAERDSHTRVTGFVDDTDELYKSAAVFVAPILTGGGIIVKVLDALAAGTPVVTTSYGNEGIAACPGEELLVADDPRSFADAVITLLQDEAKARRISVKGAAFVARHFSLEAVLDRIETAYGELAGRSQRG
ncbi:MAG TPA: glycosyltransferase family 4 protein [Geomonas sp.]